MTDPTLEVQASPWARATTLAERLSKVADEVDLTLSALLDRSRIYKWAQGDDTLVILSPSPWAWHELDDEGVLALQDARATVEQWREEARAALEVRAPELVADFNKRMSALETVVDRSGNADGPGAGTIDGVREQVCEALAKQKETLRTAGVSSAAARQRLLLVPDTNALYWNPSLEEWHPETAATIVLVPPVVSEIDSHKGDGRQEERRVKAQSLVNRMGEYGRRGDVTRGVKLAGLLDYRIVGHDAHPLPVDRLNVRNKDDAILASLLDLRRREPQAPILLVTRDQGLVNKAVARGVSVDRPPDSTAVSSARRTESKVAKSSAIGTLPDVAIGHPGCSLSTTPLHELGDGKHSRLERVDPNYTIENKGMTSIRSVTTGVRTRDGREHAFDGYRAQLIGAGETSTVENVGSIPWDMLTGVHTSAPIDSFIWWARFTAVDGARWEVGYDAGARETTWQPMDDPLQVPGNPSRVASPVSPALDPLLLRGRFYPYMYVPSVDSFEKALAIRGVIAARIPRDPEPALSSDDERAYEDAVANSYFESWMLAKTSHGRRVGPEHRWRSVEPTRSSIVTLLRPRARMSVAGWNLEARSSLSLRPYNTPEPQGWGLLVLDAVVRPDSDELRSRPLSLEEFGGLVYTILSALLDQITPTVFPRVAGTDDYELMSVSIVASASGIAFSDFVLLDRSNWGRAEGAYDPSGVEWDPATYREIESPEKRADTVRMWIKKLLRDGGFRRHEDDVDRFEMPQLQTPPET